MAPRRKPRVPCPVKGCKLLAPEGSYCGRHYKRFWRHGDPTKTLIRMDDEGKKCEVDECTRPISKGGMCSIHYARLKRAGRTHLIRAPNGSGTQTRGGYIVKPRGDGTQEYEHILIAEKALGRRLPPGAVVHHVTQNRKDNHGPFKLVVCPNQAYHMLIHARMNALGISFKEGWPNERDD